MIWNWPQITRAILAVFGLLSEASRDGKPKTGMHNFGTSLAGAMIVTAILYFGGFFAGAHP